MSGVIPDDFQYALDTNDALQTLLEQGTYRWVVNGHTHRRMVRTFEGADGQVTIINAGTLLRHHDPCFVIVDLEAGTASFCDVQSSAITPGEMHDL